MIVAIGVIGALVGLVIWLCVKLNEAWEPVSGGLIIKTRDVFLRGDTSDEMSHVVACYLRLKEDEDGASEVAREQRSEETAGLVLGGYIAGYRQAEKDGCLSEDGVDLGTVNRKAKEWILNGSRPPSPPPIVVDWDAVKSAPGGDNTRND